MSAGQSRNLPELLQQAEAAYQDHDAIRPLRVATGGVRAASSLGIVLPGVLDSALSLMGADFGNIQLVDPLSGSLRMVTQSGFDSRFVDYFAVVNDDHSACGRAAGQRAQIVIPDVDVDQEFTPHRGIAKAAGFRAVQSTPLADQAGRLVGMVSTHFERPHRPRDVDLRIMDLYADFAGQWISEHLSVPDGDQPADQDDADQDDTVSELAHNVVTRLFSVGLRLASARGIVGTGPAGDRITAAADEIDHLIRDVRMIAAGYVANDGSGTTPSVWDRP